MRSRHGASMLVSVVCDSLAGIFVLFPFPAVTQADSGLSLHPDPPHECDTLTANWHPANPTPPFYSVKIVDNNSSQTIFQTNVTSPTASATWVVNATKGASLYLAIHTPPDLNSNHYKATSFQVDSGPSSCFSPSSIITTSSPTTDSAPTSSAPTSSAPSSIQAVSTTSPTLTVAAPSTTSSTSPSNTESAPSSRESKPIYSSPSTPSAPDTSSVPPVDRGRSRSPNPSHALNPGAIAGVVIGLVLGIVLAVVALCLLRRRARPRAATKQSSFTSHIGWLPRTSRSSYTARKSLSSDTYVSEIESVKSLAAWKPEMFVREKPEAGYAQRRASRSPLAQHPSLLSGTPVTVPNRDETQ